MRPKAIVSAWVEAFNRIGRFWSGGILSAFAAAAFSMSSTTGSLFKGATGRESFVFRNGPLVSDRVARRLALDTSDPLPVCSVDSVTRRCAIRKVTIDQFDRF